MSQVNTEFEGDPEYEQFEEYVDQRGCAKATAKSYRTSYRKLRNIIGKNIRECGESNLLKIIINHYKDQITKLKEISMNRGTDLNTLLTSYNINYTDSIPEHVTDDPNKRVHKVGPNANV